MTGEKRRELIINAIKNSNEPLSGTALGRLANVSRQVVVQDIALLRAQDYPITSTNRGYIFSDTHRFTQIFKVHHSNAQIADELYTIVDQGGTIIDVIINHRVYGKMQAKLNIKNRRDVNNFLNDIKAGKSTPLMNITAGYHFHTVCADSSEILNDIKLALQKKNYLAQVLPYEQQI